MNLFKTSIALIIISISCLSQIFTVSAASFECQKATTVHEKFICNSPVLSPLDKAMGELYKSTLANFIFPEFLKDNQKTWVLFDYQSCYYNSETEQSNLKKCINAVSERIDFLNQLQDALIYSNIDEISSDGKIARDGVVIIVTNKTSSHTLEEKQIISTFGNWWPEPQKGNAEQTPDYPYGSACSRSYEFPKKSSNKYTIESDHREPVEIELNDSFISFSDYLDCGSRVGLNKGAYPTFKRP